MRTKDKVKMCPFCEGSIPIQAEECKYCGSSLIKRNQASSAYQTEDSLASLYEPPYAPTKKHSVYGIPGQDGNTSTLRDPMADQEEEIDENPLLRELPTQIKMTKKKTLSKKTTAKENEEDESEEKSKIGSLLLLSLGGHLFTLAWLLFFFSDHGKLVLEWKSRYWFVYLLLSAPLLYKGWKKLSEE